MIEIDTMFGYIKVTIGEVSLLLSNKQFADLSEKVAEFNGEKKVEGVHDRDIDG